MLNRVKPLLIVTLLLTIAAQIQAAQIVMKDTRRFEGNILLESADSVTIDTVIAGIRAKLKLNVADIASVEKGPAPAGFFDPPPAPKEADAAAYAEDNELYLEIPITGDLGKDAFAEGVRAALSYAKGNDVKHIVFLIDSSGGDMNEAITVYRALQAYSPHFKYHAVIRNCVGPALAVGLWCDTVHLVRGAKIGGGSLVFKNDDEKETRRVISAQLADEVAAKHAKSPNGRQVIRAMLDPTVQLAGWRDKSAPKGYSVGAEPPKDLPADQLIFKVDSTHALELSYDQATAMGLPSCDGDPASLGKALKLDHWKAESSYGLKAMTLSAKKQKDRADAAKFVFENRVRDSVSEREVTERYISRQIELAAQSDPAKGDYGSYSVHYGWGWGGVVSGTTYSSEDRKEWKFRCNATASYLREAAAGLQNMKRMEKVAVELGLPTTYKPGEIDGMLADLEQKYQTVLRQSQRNVFP